MLDGLSDTIREFVLSLGAYAPFAACLLIIIESILPALPLCLFITINFIAFGNTIGFIISWIFTCLGCFLSYYIVRKGLSNWTSKKAKKAPFLDNVMAYIRKISLGSLTVVLACPFTPAFAINIAAGLVNIDFKKFATAIIIGKIVMVYFWGYIGTSLIDSINNPIILLKVAIMVLLAYMFSIIVNKVTKDIK